MANHLNLRNTLCELDGQGNLMIFRDRGRTDAQLAQLGAEDSYVVYR